MGWLDTVRSWSMGQINPGVLQREQERKKKLLKELLLASHREPGDIVVTASADTFLEKRAAVQDKTANVGRFFRSLLPGTGGRAARAARAAESTAQAVQSGQAALQELPIPLSTAAQQAGTEAAIGAAGGAGAGAAQKGTRGLLDTTLGKGLLFGGPLIGLGALGAPYLERAGYGIRAEMYPDHFSRVRADEIAAESYAKSVGKELGDKTVGLLSDALSKAISVPQDIYAGHQRQGIFETIKAEDDVVGQMDPQQLEEAYHTMVRFAPTLATDKNAVKTFLRESALYGSGPNFMAIKQLADAERAVAIPPQVTIKTKK